MTKKFNFIDIDTSVLPELKRKNVDGLRFYEIGGSAYPSVTTILSLKKTEELKEWRSKVGEDVAKWEMGRAARRGNALHKLVEQYIKNETPSIRDVLPLGMFRLLKPYLDKIDNVHLLESVMYSKKLTIAGQVDCIAEYNGKLSVIDFKSANKERQESWIENYFLQTTAYGMMYEELYGKPIEQIVVLLAAEDGTVGVWTKDPKDYQAKLLESIDVFYKHINKKLDVV
jgi:genome maintenance exonuclease 1